MSASKSHTGRRCSAGSGLHPVPRRPRSYAALRRPAPISHGSGSPCQWPTALRVLVLCPLGRRHVRLRTRRASETTHWLSARPEYVGERRGPPRCLGHPLRACSGRTPRRIRSPLRPSVVGERCCLRWNPAPWASGKMLGFGAAWPMAHTLACLRFAGPLSEAVARLATGLGGRTLSRMGFAPAGRRTKFHEGITTSKSI